MGNGSIPPRLLTDNQYNTIKAGDVVTSGTYEGCVQVGSMYYWVTPDRNGDWSLQTGEPDSEYQCPIGAEIWAYCKDGGDATWNSVEEVWEDGGNSYRWGADTAGNPVSMVGV